MSETKARIESIQIQELEPQHQFFTYLLPTGDFPLSGKEREQYLDRFAVLMKALDESQGATPETLLQVWKIHHDAASKEISKNGRAWVPVVGCAVWPHKEPPHVWTIEEFKEFVPGEVPRPPIHMVFRLKGRRDQLTNVLPLMGGRGALIRAGIRGDAEEFYQKSSQYFQTFIVEPLHASFPFHFPLIDGNTLPALTAVVAEQILGTVEYYVRESVEDRGVLILSRTSLKPCFENLRWDLVESPVRTEQRQATRS